MNRRSVGAAVAAMLGMKSTIRQRQPESPTPKREPKPILKGVGQRERSKGQVEEDRLARNARKREDRALKSFGPVRRPIVDAYLIRKGRLTKRLRSILRFIQSPIDLGLDAREKREKAKASMELSIVMALPYKHSRKTEGRLQSEIRHYLKRLKPLMQG